MTGPVSRRAFLATGGLTAAAALGGCLVDNPESTAGHLYAENTTSQDAHLALWVGERGDGTPEEVLAGAYDVPASHALEFEGVFVPDRAYTVRAALPEASQSDRVSAAIDECEETPAGERSVSVRTRPDGLGVIPWGCEQSYTERELEYVSASEYRTGTVDGTVAGSTGDGTATE